MKKNYFYLLGLGLVFIALLGGLVESVSARNGGVALLAFASLWLVGTVIKVYWTKVQPHLERSRDKSALMDD